MIFAAMVVSWNESCCDWLQSWSSVCLAVWRVCIVAISDKAPGYCPTRDITSVPLSTSIPHPRHTATMEQAMKSWGEPPLKPNYSPPISS